MQAQTASVTATLDTNAIMIGDQIGLNLKIKTPKETIVVWPVLRDTLAPHIEMIKAGKIDTIKQKSGFNFSRKLIISSYDSGKFAVPALPFKFYDKTTGKTYTATTNPMQLQVYTPLVDTAKPIKIIKNIEKVPYTFGEVFPWILLAIGILVILYFVIWYIRKRKQNKPLFTKKPKPKLPPDVLAIKKLEELKLSKIWQSGKLKQYYTGLTDIMREYFSDRYQFDAREMTSDEILKTLKNHKINKEALSKVRATLKMADLVKFAKAQPTPLENDTALYNCIDFVNETKPVPEPENSEDIENEDTGTQKTKED